VLEDAPTRRHSAEAVTQVIDSLRNRAKGIWVKVTVDRQMAAAAEPIGHRPRRRTASAASDSAEADTTRASSEDGSRIVLLGGFGTGNIGNEASLAVALREFRGRVPGADIVVVCPGPEDVEQRHRVSAVSLSMGSRRFGASLGWRPARITARMIGELARWVSVFRFVRSASMVVVPGTGMLDDYSVGPLEMPYDLLGWSVVTRAARRPFAFVAVGAGPIDNPTSAKAMRFAARLATQVSYRDEISMRFMEAIGRDTSADCVTNDVVFGLVPPRAPAPRLGASSLSIGVGVMTYGGWSGAMTGEVYDRYVALAADMVTRMIRDGHRIRFLVGRASDSIAVEDIIRACLPNGVDRDHLEFRPVEDFEGLLAEIARTDVVIATRYHNLVGALLMDRSAISLSYADKNRALLERFGLGDLSRPLETADATWVLDCLGKLRDGRRNRDRDPAREIRELCRDRTRAEFAELAKLIEVHR
jgi:polysaccharide pyruvyl transferase WcaK-like protein